MYHHILLIPTVCGGHLMAFCFSSLDGLRQELSCDSLVWLWCHNQRAGTLEFSVVAPDWKTSPQTKPYSHKMPFSEEKMKCAHGPCSAYLSGNNHVCIPVSANAYTCGSQKPRLGISLTAMH